MPKELSKSTIEIVVCSALPHGQVFILPSGEKLTINGRPESRFVGENRLPLTGNQYGETHGVKKDDWEVVIKKYGSMEIFKNRIIFAAETKDEKKAKKRENKNVRTGLEQKDPKKSKITKPSKESE